MGCGALCGDTTTATNITDRYSKQAYQKLIQELKLNTQLISSPTYTTFISLYQQDPDSFHLQVRPELIRDQHISESLLIKWKMVLLGLDKTDKKYCECLGLSIDGPKSLINNYPEADAHDEAAIIAHDCFVQIEKDIERTFEIPVAQQRKRQFENVLKRIANHFPKMGYTQGINFIVSYLIIIGYTQNQCFEMFVHLATNKRYMLLGLYEDGFPLYNIFNTLFQNVLKRANESLYTHMFVELGVDPSMWICKWFMTFYIYSFPRELIKYIWDLVIGVGNLGVIMVAVSLIQQLEPIILEIGQLTDLNDFLSSLRNLQTFNQHVNLQQLLARAYSVVFIVSDFEDVEKGCFYGIYLKSYFMLESKGRDRITSNFQADNELQDQRFVQLLNNWRSSLIEQRNTFRRNNKTTNISNLKLQIESYEKSVNKGSNVDSETAIAPLEEPNTMVSSSEMARVRKNSLSSKSEGPVIVPHRVEYQFNEINQKIEEQQQSSCSKLQKKSKRSKISIRIVGDLDELDKLEIQFEQQKKTAPNLVRNNYSNAQQTKHIPNNRISIYNVNDTNSLTLAGRNSLRNDLSYDDVSVSSKQNSNKSKLKHPPNHPPKHTRICACKTKTEENRFSNVEQGSEIEESKDQFSDKDSLSHTFSQNGEPVNDTHSIRDVDTHRDRTSVRNQYMINSHGPGALQKRQEGKVESDIEVMVLQFKKNKRGRVKQVPAQLQPNNKLFKIGWQQEEDSLQQIHPIDGLSNAHSHCSHTYEIQSVK